MGKSVYNENKEKIGAVNDLVVTSDKSFSCFNSDRDPKNLIAGYAFLAIAENTLILAIGFLVLALFPALTDGVQRTLASELSSEENRGSALGYVNAISGIGLLLAGVGGGYLWQRFGVIHALIIASILVAVGLAILSSVSHART